VLGDIEPAALGPTMVHEHVFWEFNPKCRERSIAFSRRELEALRAAGARTIVDVAPHPYRLPEWYQALARQVGLHIILSTGFYLEARTTPEIRQLSEGEMAERFEGEITQGIGTSDLKAGVIKVACERADLTPWEQRVLRAAARVQRDLGVPICTHAIQGAHAQFRTLLEAGADPARIYLSHTEQEIGWEGRGVKEQIEYLVEITRQGGSLFFSSFGWEFLAEEANLRRLLLELCGRGFRDRLLVGSDANYKVDEEGNAWWEEQKNHPDLPLKTFAYTYTFILPCLRRWGFSQEDLDVFVVRNPGRLFG
jgi:phosphotriesterase-related protein